MDRAADAAPDPWTIDHVAALMHELTPHARAQVCTADAELPWGRYLVHADPRGRYNLQLDVFSRAYTGQIHAHGTWGVFWVIQGELLVSDCETRDGAAALQRVARIGAGGGQCFCPPASDWHRVATPEYGPQTLSLHLYGPGFDLDTGVYISPTGVTSYRRGPLADLEHIRGSFRSRER
jgi:predicted metal-dependent enzyme (double-stranded beta helix superfamily)